MTAPLFDVEPHGTPCLVCGEFACICRAAGTLAATPGAWPIDPPPATVPAQPATLPALRSGLTYDERRGQVWIIRDTPGRDPGYPLAAAHERPGGTWCARIFDSGGAPFLSVHDYPTPGAALVAASREAESRLMADDWPTA